MTAPELYQEATKQGLRLEPRGQKLAVIPADRVSPGFADLLRKHKAELLHWLSDTSSPGWGCIPPANLALNPERPQPSPNNRERMIAYMLRQGCNLPGDLTAWLVRRECAYYDGPGHRWDCALHAYAAARDAACWQLNRGEYDVLKFLSDLDKDAKKRPN